MVVLSAFANNLAAETYTYPVKVAVPDSSSTVTSAYGMPVRVIKEHDISTMGSAYGMPVRVFRPHDISTMGSTYGMPVRVFRPHDISTMGSAYAWPVSVNFTPAKDALPGLVATYHMDGDWNDASGNGNHGTPYGEPVFDAGSKYGSYSGGFSGSNFVDLGDGESLKITTAVTIAAWINPNTVSGTQFVAGRPYSTSSSWNSPWVGWHIGVRNGRMASWININGVDREYDAGTITAGQWHYIVMTYDGTWRKSYINGVNVYSSDTYAGSISFVGNPRTVIGVRSSTARGEYFNGLMDEVSIYDRALSVEEIQALYEDANRDKIPPTTPTVEPVPSTTTEAGLLLSGTKEEVSSIIIDNTEVVPLSGQTSWQFEYTLSEGDNLLSITSRDASGNRSEAVTIQVLLDSTPPVVVSALPADGATLNTLISTVVCSLNDVHSDVDFNATIDGAIVVNGTGAVVPGAWTIGTGSVTFTPSEAFTQGEYVVTIHPTDTLGNTITAGTAFSYDATAPSAPTIDDVGSPTNQTTLTVTGTRSEDTALITVTGTSGAVGGVSFPTATTWSVSLSALAEGNNTISVSAVDSAGNESEAVSTSVVIDTIAPGAVQAGEYPALTTRDTVTLTGTKETDSYLYVNGVKTPVSYSDTSWSYAITLGEGENVLGIHLEDEAGNTGEPLSVVITRDTTAPFASSSTPTGGSATNEATTIEVVLADSNSSVELEASLDGAIVEDGQGNAVAGAWSVVGESLVFTPAEAFLEGAYTVTLQPVDTLGNTGTATLSFSLDPSPPTVSTFTMNPTSPHRAETVAFVVTFNEDMDTGVQPSVVFEEGWIFTSSHEVTGNWTGPRTWVGTFTFTSETGDDEYKISVSEGSDAAGNIMADYDAGSLVVDTVLPGAPTVDEVLTPTNVPTQTLAGSKPRDTAIVINGAVRVATDTESAWSYDYPLNEGLNTINVSARDFAGNDSPEATVEVELKTTPPDFTITEYTHPSPTRTQALSGTKDPGITVTLNNEVIIEATDESIVWSYEVSLTEGITTRLTFIATDSLGNTRTRTIDILYDASAPSPLAPGVLVADGSGTGLEATLSWDAYVEGPDIAYYRAYYSTADFNDTTGMTPVGTVNKGTSSFKVAGLSEGTLYHFAIVPVDASGNSDPSVNTAEATTSDTAAPEEVTGLSAAMGYNEADGDNVTLSWTPSRDSKGDLADQTLYVDDGTGYDEGASLGSAVTTYAVKGLTEDTLFKFKVTTRDTAGHESAGSIVTAVTRLPNPTDLTAEPGKGKVTLNWGPPETQLSSYVKYYNVYRVRSASAKTDIGAMTLVNALKGTSFVDTGLANGTTYQYAVTAVNTFGVERTDVQSLSATPREDDTGPVISGLDLIDNQVIVGPLNVTASAEDEESAMDRVEMYVDGVLVKTGTEGSVSWYWNVVDSTDGNHTIKIVAYDSLGNSTEVSVPVILSLAPPETPSITSHAIEAETPEYLITVNGLSPLYTTVLLKVGDAIIGEAQTTEDGKFAFTSVALVEGDNLLYVKTKHRGGESAFSSGYKIIVDTGAPEGPANLSVKALAGGALKFSWEGGVGETPTGFNLYESLSALTSTTEAGVTKVNAKPFKYFFTEYIPADDTLRHYAVTALDGVDNESAISNAVSIASDRAPPSISDTSYNFSNGVGLVTGAGTVTVGFIVSEPLAETPFFSLEPETGSPIVVGVNKVGENSYEGSFTVSPSTPHGQTTYKFSGKDLLGNRGSSEGPAIAIDVNGPTAAVTSPLTLLKLTAEPVLVGFTLDEASVIEPLLELKDSGGATAEVVGLSSGSGGIVWTGTVDISGLSKGDAAFVLASAKDAFGNVSANVPTGALILLYAEMPPAPAIPTGLVAKAEEGGEVVLSWVNVEGAGSYNVYSRGEGEETPALVGGFEDTTAINLPPSDGTYYYSVASVGLLESESERSVEAEAASDRTPPDAPTGLTLSLDGNGVVAKWQAPAEAASYGLYRADGVITLVAGLTSVATVDVTEATDPSPASNKRFYAVTALDLLGNESGPSETAEINFPVAPVREMLLTVIDDGKPVVTWQAPDGELEGYYIYRNGSRINSSPSVSTSFTDGYYPGGTVTYGVSAVDIHDNESPVKEIALPDITIGLKDGTTLTRGALETVSVVLGNNASDPNAVVSVSGIELKLGSNASSTLQGPFAVSGGGGSFAIDKVVATALDAGSTVAVVAVATLAPSPGATVKVVRTSSVSVAGSSAALELYNEPFVRGGGAEVRLKVNNLGSAVMEFLTSQGGGPTNQVLVNLIDQDGNLLATGSLDQRTGNVVNVGSYTLARINPGESFLTDPITFTVPVSAPYRVMVEAVIENTYYRYNKPDQVTAPGMTLAVETTIAEVPYVANAEADKAVYTRGEQVIITGQARSSDSGEPVPGVPVKLGVSVKGFDRFYTVDTDASGNFTHTFVPGPKEAGTYSLWAVHPDISDRTVQAQFSIVGIDIAPSAYDLTIPKNVTWDIDARVSNPGDVPLTGLNFTSEASGSVTAGVLGLGTELAPGEERSVKFRISALSDAPDNGYARITVASAEGATRDFNVNLALIAATPAIWTEPNYIDTGLVRGTQKVVTFDITNRGYETLKNARLEGPSLPWMSLTVDPNLGDIKPGVSVSVGVLLRPGEDVAQDVYDDRIVIYSDNHDPYNYNVQATVTSEAVGNALFDVINEFYEDVPDAAITIQHQKLLELIYEVKTNADGTVSKFDIPEGRYSYHATAKNHVPHSGSFTIEPGVTTAVQIALEVSLIDIEWSVTETTIEDVYDITVSQTFETNVPAPVLIIEPAFITLPPLQPGQVFNSEFTVTNYGLVALNEMRLEFPAGFSDFDIEVFTGTVPETLAAMESFVVPYKVTKRAVQSASLFDTNLYAACTIPSPGGGSGEDATSSYMALLSEVQGFGGSCGSSTNIAAKGNYNPCGQPRTKSASHTISDPPSSSCSGTTGGPTGGGGGGNLGPQQGGAAGTLPRIVSCGDDCEDPLSCDPGCTEEPCSCEPACTPSENECINTNCKGGECVQTWKPDCVPGCEEGGTCEQCEPACEEAKDPCTKVVCDGGACKSLKIEGCEPPCEGKDCEDDSDDCTESRVIMANGTYEFGEDDLRVPAKGPDIEWTRTYRSNAVVKREGEKDFVALTDGPLGFGWNTPYFVRIEGGDTYVDAAGGYYAFEKDESGNFIEIKKDGLVLRQTAVGFEVEEIGGDTHLFDIDGKLLSLIDANGNTLTMVYDAEGRLVRVKDVTSRDALTFVYDDQGHITKATDASGRSVNYEYDALGNLVKVVDPAGNFHTYTYNEYHGVLSKTNPLDETVAIEYAYPFSGVVGKVIDPAGNAKTYEYDMAGRAYSVTDKNGRKVSKTLDSDGYLASQTDAATGSGTNIERLADGTIKKTDELGNVTVKQEDERGNVIRRVDAEGNQWSYTYNADNRLTNSTSPDGRVDSFEYDAKGNLVKETLAKGTSEALITTYVYDPYGQITSITSGGAVTAFTYDGVGNVDKITDPLGNSTTMEYDAGGNLTALTDARGNTSRFTYDQLGNVLTVTDPISGVTEYAYNADGRLTGAKDPLGRTMGVETDYKGRKTATVDALGNRKEFTYDAEGNLVAITEGDAVTAMAYDTSKRLASVTDAEGNTTTYEYATSATCGSCGGGSAKRPVKVTDPLGNLTQFSFDKNGNITGIKDPLLNFTGLTLDNLGRVSVRIDANNNTTAFAYDLLGRVVTETDANGGVTTFTYDAQGRLASLSDPKGNTTAYLYDLAGRVTKETRPMHETTEYTYYPNGLVKTVKDAKAQVTSYTYDAANRLTEITYADNSRDAFTYDKAGNMLTYSGGGVSGTLTYDALNRKLTETMDFAGVGGAFSKTFSYTYDSRGNKASYTSAEGTGHSYAYNKINRPISMAFDGKTVNFDYQWKRLVKAAFPGDVTTDYQYNANSWLAAIITRQGGTTLLTRQYGLDKVGNVTTNSTDVGDYGYSYDKLYELTGVVDPVLDDEAYTYDAAGNRLSSTSTQGGWTYNAGNALLGFDTVSYAYDNNGNTIEKNVNGVITRYVYDARNRLASVELPGGNVVTYAYDPFGRRVKKSITPSPLGGEGGGEGDATFYLYTAEGLSGEYSATGGLNKGYGWKPNSTWGTNPVFMTEGGSYYYYHNDRLGAPQKMTDNTGAIVWSANYTAFGAAYVDPASTIENNLRFPGQYFDSETGLHYNWNRYYDPATGRYTQKDPIGFMAGDSNLYRYVKGNPVNVVDSDGQIAAPVLIALAYVHYTRNDDMNEAVTDDWEKGVDPRLHRYGEGNEDNIKLISPDGHHEVITDKNGNKVTSPANRGTYNYCDPSKNKICHVVVDVVPYLILGNSLDDPTVMPQRVGMAVYALIYPWEEPEPEPCPE